MELNREIKRLKKRAEKLDRQNRALTAELEALKSVPKAPTVTAAPAPAKATTPRAAAHMAPPSAPAVTPAPTPAQSRGSAKRPRDEDEHPTRATEARVQARDENHTTGARLLASKPGSGKLAATDRTLGKTRLSPSRANVERKTLAAKNVFRPQEHAP